MNKGKVKFFNSTRGFGFIINEEDEKEIFFHVSEVKADEQLKEGDTVTFGTKEGKKGLNAIDVKQV